MNYYIRVFKSRLDTKLEGWFHDPCKAINKLTSLAHDLPDDQIMRLQITFSNTDRFNYDIAAGIVKSHHSLDETICLTNQINRSIQQQLNLLTNHPLPDKHIPPSCKGAQLRETPQSRAKTLKTTVFFIDTHNITCGKNIPSCVKPPNSHTTTTIISTSRL